jgi:hypothetical protein
MSAQSFISVFKKKATKKEAITDVEQEDTADQIFVVDLGR